MARSILVELFYTSFKLHRLNNFLLESFDDDQHLRILFVYNGCFLISLYMYPSYITMCNSLCKHCQNICIYKYFYVYFLSVLFETLFLRRPYGAFIASLFEFCVVYD